MLFDYNDINDIINKKLDINNILLLRKTSNKFKEFKILIERNYIRHIKLYSKYYINEIDNYNIELYISPKINYINNDTIEILKNKLKKKYIKSIIFTEEKEYDLLNIDNINIKNLNIMKNKINYNGKITNIINFIKQHKNNEIFSYIENITIHIIY